MSYLGGANRIELESQILCSALRLSLAEMDIAGVLKTCQELYHLFPDLLPPPGVEKVKNSENFYDLLEIECDVNPSMILAAYFKTLKRFLRDQPNPGKDSSTYFKILNAGFVLRKPRLRLSHDLIVCRSKLIDEKAIPVDGALENLDSSDEMSFEPTGKEIDITKPEASLPKLIELMKAARFTGPAEVQALINQMELYPNIRLEDLVLRAGYVTEAELKSLQLAEYLLTQGKINMGQFSVSIDNQFPDSASFDKIQISDLYGDDLAYIQDRAYSQFSRDVSSYLVKKFTKADPPIKQLVDIGCGAGYSSSIFTEAGFQVTAIEPSASLIRIAKENAPKANFVNKSIYDAGLPKCDAIIAIGEPLTYHPKEDDALGKLRELFKTIHHALPRGGLFVFDLIVTGTDSLSKKDWIGGEDWSIQLEVEEDVKTRTLTRTITVFRKVGKEYRKSCEKHHIRIFDKKEIEALLQATGFSVETDTSYGPIALGVRRVAFSAVRM